jgi:hypothetical protein
LVIPSTSSATSEPNFSRFVERGGGVLHHVVEKSGHDRCGVEFELCRDGGHRERMTDERLAGETFLFGVFTRGKFVGAVNQAEVGLGVVGANLVNQLFELVRSLLG